MTEKEWRMPPKDALKEITFGKLKGKSDINPQWRIDALNERFGVCGDGWCYEVGEFTYKDVPDGVFIGARLSLYYKTGGAWSAPVLGFGGDLLVKQDKNGTHCNDDAIKGVVTDALGNACKHLGIAGDVYRGIMGTKYSRENQDEPQPPAKKAPPRIDIAGDAILTDEAAIQQIMRLAKEKRPDIAGKVLADIDRARGEANAESRRMALDSILTAVEEAARQGKPSQPDIF